LDIEKRYDDKDNLVVLKPFAMPCEPDKTGDEDLKSLVEKQYNGKKECFLINRIDRPVGGLVLFAKNGKTAAFLSDAMQKGKIKKNYYAVVCGKPENESGMLQNWLLKDGRNNTSKVVSEGTKNAKYAQLKYEILDCCEDIKYGKLTLLKVSLKTGRHHQIRAQFADIGLPLWGDSKYNPAFKRLSGFTNIGLWSYEIAFPIENTKTIQGIAVLPRNGVFTKFESVFNCI